MGWAKANLYQREVLPKPLVPIRQRRSFLRWCSLSSLLDVSGVDVRGNPYVFAEESDRVCIDLEDNKGHLLMYPNGVSRALYTSSRYHSSLPSLSLTTGLRRFRNGEVDDRPVTSDPKSGVLAKPRSRMRNSVVVCAALVVILLDCNRETIQDLSFVCDNPEHL